MFSTFPIRNGKLFRSVVQINGKPLEATGKTAKAAESNLLDKLQAVNAKTPSIKMTVGQALDLYIERCKERGRAPKTIRDYKYHAEALKARIGPKKISELKPLDVEAALEGVEPKAALNRRALLRATINKVPRKVAPDLPNVAAIAELAESYTAVGARPFVDDELDRFLLAEEDKQALAMWLLMADSGLRPSEAANLQWSEIFRAQDGWWIRKHEAKTQEGKKPIPISDVVEKALREVTRHAIYVFPSVRKGRKTKKVGPIDVGTWGEKFQATLAKAKIPSEQVSMYSLRHTFANMIRRKASQDVLRRLMRHTDVRTTQRYYIDPEDAELRNAKA